MKVKEQKPVVSKIILNLRGKEISLSIDEAEELKEILGKLFGKECVVHIERPWYPYTYPLTPWYGTTWTVSCDDAPNSTSTYISSGVTPTDNTMYITANATT